MQSMFWNDSNFNQPIGNWDVSKVGSMRQMLRGTSFNQDIGNWDVSSVTSMELIETLPEDQRDQAWQAIFMLIEGAKSSGVPIAEG